MAKRLKIIEAGPLVYEYLVPVQDPTDSKAARAGKHQLSSQAQQKMNLKNSWRQLELIIAKNFWRDAMVVTFTYDDDNLPVSKDAAAKQFQKFIRKLRASRRSRGDDLKYIFVTEGYHGKSESEFVDGDSDLEDKRLHHHVVLNRTGKGDYEELHSLWMYGQYIRVELLDVHYMAELARYLTKEAREVGRGKPGERTWRASRNLKKYKVEYEYVRESTSLKAPPGAVDYIQEGNENQYGEFRYARYLIFKNSHNIPDYSYTKGRRKIE